MNAISVGNYGVVSDHKSCLGPNNWLLFNDKFLKHHKNKDVFKQNILTECLNIPWIFFLISGEKIKKLWGRKGPQCDHFRTSEEARCGSDLAATGQCSPPLHAI